MAKAFFPEVKERISFEGARSNNPLAFKVFDPKRKVGDRTMAEHLKFAVAYWHALGSTGRDPFGDPVYKRSWSKGSDPMVRAESSLEAMFEFVQKLGISHYCFHDRDIAPEGNNISETNKNLQKIVDKAERLQKQTGIRLLWGTANLFGHPRYTHGAATNPDPKVMAYAASQVRRALDATVQLGGTGYVFWGGREGYSSLLNTDLKQEREQLARFLHMAVEYGQKIGFKGVFFIEPKPKEPATHQYDFDTATTLGFLREFDLLDYFMLNVEANHATLAGHSFHHELLVASIAGKLGSLDINRGNLLLGWDTDQFPTDLYDAAMAMLVILQQGGLKYGGLNFDAKVRCGSFDSIDLFHAHIGGIDTFARGLLVAQKIIEDKVLQKAVEDRYAGYKSGMGQKILKGKTSLPELEKWALRQAEPVLKSGREEALENIVNQYLCGNYDE
jgi:xylose isomerase